MEECGGPAHDDGAVRQAPQHVGVGPAARRHVVRVQREGQLHVAVGVEPPRELAALVLQVGLHRESGAYTRPLFGST